LALEPQAGSGRCRGTAACRRFVLFIEVINAQAKRSDPDDPADLNMDIRQRDLVLSRFGAPRKLSFPCTLETELLLQRLEREQLGRENNRRDARPKDHQKPSPAGIKR